MTNIFALTNHKGGVGKSTSATTLALGLVAVLRNAGVKNHRVLLIDTDSQGHATLVTTGRNDFGTKDSLYTVLMAERQTAAQVLSTCVVASEWDADLHVLPANTVTCASISFVVSRYANEASLFVESSTGNIAAFEAPLSMSPHNLSSSDLDVQLGRISYTSSTLTVRVRIFNPTKQAISIRAEEFSLILGFVPNPTGLAISPIVETQTINPHLHWILFWNFRMQVRVSGC